MSRRSRKVATSALCVLAAAVVAAGCSDASTSAPTTTSTHSVLRGLPPGFVPHAVSAVAVLDVTPVAHVDVASLHRTPLPPGEVANATHALVLQPVATNVRPLLVSSTTISPGETVTVAGGDLPATPPHDALFVLQGPADRYERLVQVRYGVAVGEVHLPSTMASGSWAIAVEDGSQIHATSSRVVAGTDLVDLGIFKVS